VALVSSAAAAPGDGAQVTKTRQCDTIESGIVCIDDHIVSNFQVTPSGNTVIIGNSRFDIGFTSSGGACSFEQSGQENFHVVFGPHVSASGDLFRQEFRFPTLCNGGDILVCETVMQVHQVNGVLQFQRSSAECHEEPAP
jgi:hypothetical protein